MTGDFPTNGTCTSGFLDFFQCSYDFKLRDYGNCMIYHHLSCLFVSILRTDESCFVFLRNHLPTSVLPSIVEHVRSSFFLLAVSPRGD